ncbi:hypothetical protein Pmar_PMAR024543 [Perkinsus marinus ATCC 50983]|uniref:Uncharacterized protein n=1 Tax=Perkinsus marinus (strain ATCC 50983 / TXsc) TaxID=423536 RepID=C5LT98_PERM5|nr:hypothetical protein Pmar_PMAR024543 [Perkinsus marinus ATCC 50983]EER00066.1 hypothetical protein Pmar_PMAR024543 [Perkinsus marinus ATCC 50983]|eukprot:XP_002767348.1 hypothetical protein Pmar_PMAR024543 [Perkinsus marinus ATCC 50983]
MSTPIDSNYDIERNAAGGDNVPIDKHSDQSGFIPPAGCEGGDPGDLTSGMSETLYLPGNNLNGSDFFPTLEGLDDEAPFERARKMAKMSSTEEFPCGPSIGDDLGPSDAVPDTSVIGSNDNSALLIKLLTSTDVDRDLPSEGLDHSQALYSALVGLATSDSRKSTLGPSDTSKASADSSSLSHRPPKRPFQGQQHSGPALILGPELFSAVVSQSSGPTPLAAAVTTPTIGRSTGRSQANNATGKFAGAQNFPNDDANGPVRVVRRVHGWVTILRNGGRQATGPYRETVHQCVEDQKEVHRLRAERGMTNTEVMQLLEQMKHVTDRHPSTLLIKKPKKLDYAAPIGVRRMHKGYRASVRVRGREVYGPLRQDVADASCDRAEMMKYRHVVDAPGMRAFVKTLKERVYPHHEDVCQASSNEQVSSSSSSQLNHTQSFMPVLHSDAQGPILPIS